MIPITAIALLEYFLINTGSVEWLEYLPSITWPNWTFTLKFTDFEKYLTESVSDPKCSPPHHQQLLYQGIVENPRSAPRFLGSSPRRCRQPRDSNTLEETWILHLLYYQSWYALSWGSCIYIAVMLVDLDVTYKRRIYLYARPFKYYPLLISCIVLSLVGLSTDLLTQLTGINYPTFEYGIHPSISQADLPQYPPYYNPRLNGLAFATALELSPALQEHFSLRPFNLLFSHTFTIYLIHGFVVWSLGSWLCVTLSVHGLSFWANILVVAVCCYAAIALWLPLLTPLVETLGGGACRDLCGSMRVKNSSQDRRRCIRSRIFFLGLSG